MLFRSAEGMLFLNDYSFVLCCFPQEMDNNRIILCGCISVCLRDIDLCVCATQIHECVLRTGNFAPPPQFSEGGWEQLRTQAHHEMTDTTDGRKTQTHNAGHEDPGSPGRQTQQDASGANREAHGSTGGFRKTTGGEEEQRGDCQLHEHTLFTAGCKEIGRASWRERV